MRIALNIAAAWITAVELPQIKCLTGRPQGHVGLVNFQLRLFFHRGRGQDRKLPPGVVLPISPELILGLAALIAAMGQHSDSIPNMRSGPVKKLPHGFGRPIWGHDGHVDFLGMGPIALLGFQIPQALEALLDFLL